MADPNVFPTLLNSILTSITNGIAVMTTVYGAFGLSLLGIFAVMITFVIFKSYIFDGFVK